MKQRPPTSDTTSPGTAAAAHVMTPDGPGRIVKTLTTQEWVFGRPRRRVTHVVEYRNGRRHAWVSERVERL